VASQTAAVPAAVVYTPVSVSGEARRGFEKQGFKLDVASGNYLSAKVYSKTLHEPLVPVLIDGRYATDLQRKPIFLRKTVRDKLLEADAEMFKKNQHSTKQAERHIILNYGFRSNALQQELFVKLKGHGKVAPPGASFHETGMALDVSNTKEAHKYLIHAGFVGGATGSRKTRSTIRSGRSRSDIAYLASSAPCDKPPRCGWCHLSSFARM
jgi:D-alanyl-D-alanine carboxypeptidase